MTKEVFVTFEIFTEYHQGHIHSLGGGRDLGTLCFACFTPLRIKAEHRGIMENPITASEFAEAIDRLKLTKAPGPDGLMAEFY